MRIEFTSQGIDRPERLRRRVEKQLRASLSRFSHRVEGLSVTLRDLNGPRGGVDTELCVEARLQGATSIRITERALTPDQALGRGRDRVRRAVRRSLSRSQSRRRSGFDRTEAA